MIIHDFGTKNWEIGYDIFSSHRCQGYASRAALLLAQGVARETGRGDFILKVSPTNIASQKVAEKIGAKLRPEPTPYRHYANSPEFRERLENLRSSLDSESAEKLSELEELWGSVPKELLVYDLRVL